MFQTDVRWTDGLAEWTYGADTDFSAPWGVRRKKIPADCWTLYLKGTMQIPSWLWNISSTLHGYWHFAKAVYLYLHMELEDPHSCVSWGVLWEGVEDVWGAGFTGARWELHLQFGKFVPSGCYQGYSRSLILFVMFMDRISRHTQEMEGVQNGDLRNLLRIYIQRTMNFMIKAYYELPLFKD